jgi:hypothetical protein
MVCLLFAGCVAPARSFEAYEGKAASTAESVASAVETARLATAEAAGGRAFAPYLSVVIAGAEGDAGTSEDTFASIQPPDERSLELRRQLLELVHQAGRVLGELRIAVRWGDLERLPEIAAPLRPIGERLAAFAESHG